MRDRIEAAVFSACILLFIAATLWASTAGATTWHQTGASVFGQPCDPGEVVGYRGDPIAQRPDGTYPNPLTFAELGMGTYLGGLKYRQKIRVKDMVSKRSITLWKIDIGLGGSAIAGLRRGLDVLWPALRRLLKGRASCSWTGQLWWRVLK